MISELRLRNFKCFLDEPIKLSGLNLLTGLNGMGKSSVIQSLLLLRQNHENGLLTTQKRLSLNGEYVNIGTSHDLLFRYFDQREIGIELKLGSRSYSWVWDASETSDSLPEKSFVGDGEFVSLSIFGKMFHYLNAERIGPRSYYETSTFKVIHQNQMGVRGEYAANYFSINKETSIPIELLKFKEPISRHSLTLNEVGNSLYEQVSAWMSVIRPGVQVRILDQPDSATNTLLFEFIMSKDNPGPYKSQNVGFGLTYVFPLLVAILSSQPGTMLLIENPEAHIHPRGQAELGVLLALAAEGGIQLIVETHSDHILNGVRFAVKNKLVNKSLINMAFFSGTVVKEKFLHYVDYISVTDDGKLSHRPSDFYDVWDEMLIKLI